MSVRRANSYEKLPRKTISVSARESSAKGLMIIGFLLKTGTLFREPSAAHLAAPK